jgi:hypothetical protein
VSDILCDCDTRTPELGPCRWCSVERDVERLRADNARLSKALVKIAAEWLDDDGRLEDEYPGVGSIARAALVTCDASQWLRERERRVAERAWRTGFTRGREFEDLDTLEAMLRVGEFEPDLDALLKEET